MTREQQIKSVAAVLSNAYWKGKLDSLRESLPDEVFAQMVAIAADTTEAKFRDVATKFVDLLQM